MRRFGVRWRITALVAVALVAGFAAVRHFGKGAPRADAKPAWVGKGEVPNPRHEVANPGVHQAKFALRSGKEARRQGPSSPAAEEVENRAYPRSYVDDHRSLRGYLSFRSLPRRPAVRGAAARQVAAAVVAGPWTELGPFTPNVAGANSQFFDPKTLTGPTTQESGRVTAIAIDPSCQPGACRMWVASAGGGIWRTPDALASPVQWTPPPADLPTNAYGSLYYDAANSVLYAGSGEPNGSSDSEAGLGLFRSTDGGASWIQVPGSLAVATNRSIGAIAIDPSDPSGHTIYIGTALARHGSSSVNGGRRTPPNAPTLGVYKSTDNGATFSLQTDLQGRTPPNPNPSGGGMDYFQGGINKLEFDPNNPHELYAAVLGYGVWRADQSTANPTWEQVFHTMNQNNFSNPANPTGDTFGDRSEFDLVNVSGSTRAYLGDSSDDFATSGNPALPLAETWRVDNIGNKTAGQLVNNAGTTPPTENPGWTMLSNATNGTSGYASYNFCQNGQCGYDAFVAHPPGGSPDTVWFGGSMNYNELPAYDQNGTGAPPRSNGRAVIRSINGGAGTQLTAGTAVNWQDMTAILTDPNQAWGVQAGIHPDLHSIAFANQGNTAFIGSDGGVVRIDVSAPQNQSASCAKRTYDYGSGPVPLTAADLADCQRLLSGVPTSITPLNDGLRDLQFQSVSSNPANPTGDLLGGTQDNGTWSITPPSPAALETVGGDGGQSGFDAADPSIRYHNYFSASPDVNFHGTNPNTWLAISDPLAVSAEASSFYTPFIADPRIGGRLFTGLQHVWRADDNGGSEQDLIANGCSELNLNPARTKPCGDWVQLGQDLTSTAFGADRGGQYVVATERSPSDNGTLWAATRTGRIFVTGNADAQASHVQFFRIDTPSTPGRFVSGIAIDPNNPNHAFVSYSGYDAYTPATPGHVFDVRYDPTTHQATFTDISFNLGDQPITGVAQDEVSGAIFAATDFGVAELTPGANQWNSAGTGLPTSSVFGLTLSHNGRVLYAATHGRGVWSLALPAAPGGGGGGGGGGGVQGSRSHPTAVIQNLAPLELGKKATFSALGSASNGAPVTFSWILPGRPSTATGPRVSFTPTMIGVQTVVLTVTDSTGADTTVTQAVTVRDTRTPTVRLRRIGTVRLGRLTKVRGTVTDASGIKLAILSWGDGTPKVRLHLGRGGAFTVHHRYAKTGRFVIRLTATDKTHHIRTSRATAKVRPRHS